MKYIISLIAVAFLALPNVAQTTSTWFAHSGGQNIQAVTGGGSVASTGFIIGGISSRILSPGDSTIADVRLGFYDCTLCDKTVVINVEALDVAGVLVYPNPATDKLTLEGRSPSEYQYKLTTVEGKVLLEGAFEQKVVLDLPPLARGIYLIQVLNSRTGKALQDKLVIE